MKRLFLIPILVIAFSGCVSVDPNLLLKRGTPVQIMDVTKDPIISGLVGNDYKAMTNRLIEYTTTECSKRGIRISTESNVKGYKLKYDIRNYSRVAKFWVIYRVYLEAPDGKIVFTDEDDKNDEKIDDLLDSIASRTARVVARSFEKEMGTSK